MSLITFNVHQETDKVIPFSRDGRTFRSFQSTMNEASLNIFNAIAFAPATEPRKFGSDPFGARETGSVVASALSREFGRIVLLIAATLMVATVLILSSIQSSSSSGRPSRDAGVSPSTTSVPGLPANP